jgi:hypothetical protein
MKFITIAGAVFRFSAPAFTEKRCEAVKPS